MDGGWYLWAGLIAAVVLAHAWGQWFISRTERKRTERRQREIQRLMDLEMAKPKRR